jgi:hypothetical protein
MRHALKGLSLLALSMLIGACSKGGLLTLEPNARIVKSKGAPAVTVNQGGKALVVQQGETPTTGVHGWVTIQTVSSRSMNSTSGHNMILNKTAAQR